MSSENMYTADHHFFHGDYPGRDPKDGIINWCNRPFDNLSQMTEYMIEAHNAAVESDTNVYFLGDFCLSKDTSQIKKIFDKLKGRKHLIKGNHDKNATLKLNWSSHPKYRHTVVDEGRHIYLDHMACRSWEGMYRGAFHFYGHTHGRLPSHGKSIDVGVDCWDFKPITATMAIERMMKWNADYDTYVPERKNIIRSPEENLDPLTDAMVNHLENEETYDSSYGCKF